MIAHTNRIGRFTSSNIWKLTTKARDGKSFGAPALTYIEEKRAERCLGRGLELGKTTQSMVWGKVLEYYLHEHVLGLEYKMCSKDTETHPKYVFWSGSPDFQTSNTAVESKCFEPKAFYEITKDLMLLQEKAITLVQFKAEWKEVYWQVVSNGIILNKPKCEIIAFTPTYEQIMHLRKLVEESDITEKAGLNPWETRFIYEKPIEELPYIPEHSKWPNLVKYSFQPPAEDIIFLTKCVLDAEKLLTDG